MERNEHFDAVVVGSGFGGAVSAYRLAEAGRQVCVLERGQAYAPGDFPRGAAAIRNNFWDPSRGGLGMFDFWSFRHLEALVSSGLGGGSLIYANVMLEMSPEWFDGWPITHADLAEHYAEVRRMLKPMRYPVDTQPYDRTRKASALTRIAHDLGHSVTHPELAVAFTNGNGRPVPATPIVEREANYHGRDNRFTCRLCGECDIGCNSGSKNSLDFTYLSAAQRAGATIRPLHQVIELRPTRLRGGRPGYVVTYVRHDPGDPRPTRDLTRRQMTCERLILAAGTLGTTYLLLKNHKRFPGIRKPPLGSRFCGNGDLLGLVSRSSEVVNGQRQIRRLDPSHGPVITTSIQIRDRERGNDYLVQDGGFPEFFGWMLEGRDLPGLVRRAAHFAGRRVVHWVTRNPRSNYGADLLSIFGDGGLSSGAMPLLGMGNDTPDGIMSVTGDQLKVNWSTRTSRRYFDQLRTDMRRIAAELEGRYADNPIWHVGRRVITVHPLGGCPMNDDPSHGVVDPYGEVHSHPGMYVVDGSVMPGPVVANPAFTIAAFADRAATRFAV